MRKVPLGCHSRPDIHARDTLGGYPFTSTSSGLPEPSGTVDVGLLEPDLLHAGTGG
ncbi:hypothetical protein AGR2A_Cc160262 [Agrobacterium genomosp. 2 str. CFBP 5494]|uniref:Uncharacterized protein n=1 Tax=Agrobacterium genomosp. 2 str. CFBP 5494 TaxID=1183436 RepID=A0A9W5B0P7_9HYPH|nr:hypothetical protein AGR2A_Cc160262 [Agrobacterium genomosp. 2 str. CFBP 5494]